MNINEEALEFHRKHRGKIEVKSKIPIKDEKSLSLAYTPGVAEPCRKIFTQEEKIYDYTSKGNMVAVVTDGSAVLGLGNIGHKAAYPVMEGKAMLFRRFAKIDALPLVIKTQDPDEFIQVVLNIADSFAAINLEDISAPRCFYIEEKLQRQLSIPIMHDDQHGTATVVLAAVENALTILPKDGKKTRIVVVGAGAAGLAVTHLLLQAGFKQLTVVDSHGILSRRRRDLNPYKAKIARLTNPEGQEGALPKALRGADIFIGVSRAKVLRPAWVKLMREQPIIIAMANPEPEIMPDEAYRAGAGLVATGRSDYPNQVNNALAFPGIFRAAIDRRRRITEKMFIQAAKAIVNYHRPRLSRTRLLPSILDLRAHRAIVKALERLEI